MRRLVDGLAGWATYHQACGAGTHYDEHLFYQHIRAIAQGRNWQVKEQQPIDYQMARKRRGAPSSVDFVFFRRPGNQWSRKGLVFVEIKYLRGDNPSQDIANIRKDIDKLRSLQPNDLVSPPDVTECGSPARFLFVLAQGSGLAATIKLKSRDNRDLITLLRKARRGGYKSLYHAQGDTHLESGLEWHAFAIGSARWPK